MVFPNWWQNGNAVQVATFNDGTENHKVVGEPAADPSKVRFLVPAGTYETVVFSRHSSADAAPWNQTGAISLNGSEGKNMVATFAENSTDATWGNYDGAGIEAPACPAQLYAIGNIQNVGWTPGSGVAFTKNGQVFTSDTITFVPEGTNTVCYFCFTSTNSTDWNVVNANRFGTSANIVAGAAAVALTYPGEKNAIIAPGSYIITVDWSTMTVSAVAVEIEQEPETVAGVVLWPAAAVLPTAVPAQVRVLSLNNSLIHYEAEFQDAIFNQMATAMGKDAIWTEHTNLGKSLKYHYDEGEGLTEAGTPSARMLIRNNAYTHIILQEQTTKPLTNFAGFRESITDWVNYIRTNGANPNAVIIMPINWALADGGDVHGNNAKLKKAYLELAQELGLVLSPVGVAYELAYTNDASVMTQGNRWFKDDRHPTQMTTYLGAVLEYATIFGVAPSTITWKPATVTDAEATQMRTLAEQAIAATSQPVNIYNHSIRFEVHQVSAAGNSLGKIGATYSGAQLTDSIFACATAGNYTVNAVCNETNLSANVTVADMVTTVAKLPSIKVNAENTTVTENFDSMTYPAADATLIEKGVYGNDYALPTAWRMERNQVGPRTIGAYSSAMLTAQYGGGVNLPTNASNGTWNLGTNGSSDRALGGMTTSVANGARTINIMTHFENDGTEHFDTLRIAYDIEKYREGSNENLFYVKLFTSSNGVNWTAAGDAFTWMNPAGSGQTGFATVPGFTQHVEADLAYHFAAGTDLYLCWSISTSEGDNCAAAPCLAIDNVNIEFVQSAMPTAAHYIYVNDQTGWETLGLYAWGDAELYGGWPGTVMIGTLVTDSCTYKVFPYDVTTAGTYNLIFNNYNHGVQLDNYVVNEARDYYLLVTPTGVSVNRVTPDNKEEEEPEYAGILLTTEAATYTQTFDALPFPAADATSISGFNGVYGFGTTLPQGWRVERNEVGPRIIGSYAAASDTLQYQGGVSLPSNAKNGTWNLGQNGSSDRAVGGMTTGAAGGARTINIMAFVKNGSAEAIDNLNIAYDVEKYRDGSNANQFYVKLFTSVNGTDWTAADGFEFINPKGSAQTGFATVPAASTPVEGVLNTTIPAEGWLHLCWSIATSAGADAQAAPCLAIDNVVITANYNNGTATEHDTLASDKVIKCIENGTIVIIKNGVRYSLLGSVIR